MCGRRSSFPPDDLFGTPGSSNAIHSFDFVSVEATATMPIPAFVAGASANAGLRSLPRTATCSRARAGNFLSAARFFVGALSLVSPFTGARASCDASGGAQDTAGVCEAPRMASGAGLADLAGLRTIDGSPLPADTFAGKVTLAVNVASACGYTDSGYRMMSEVKERHPDDVVVVAVPCNAFGRQENGTPGEISKFAGDRVKGVVVTERSEVNGPESHPIMALGKKAFPGDIGWNFDGVFLFDRKGLPVQRFGNSADAAEVMSAVENLL